MGYTAVPFVRIYHCTDSSRRSTVSRDLFRTGQFPAVAGFSVTFRATRTRHYKRSQRENCLQGPTHQATCLEQRWKKTFARNTTGRVHLSGLGQAPPTHLCLALRMRYKSALPASSARCITERAIDWTQQTVLNQLDHRDIGTFVMFPNALATVGHISIIPLRKSVLRHLRNLGQAVQQGASNTCASTSLTMQASQTPGFRGQEAPWKRVWPKHSPCFVGPDTRTKRCMCVDCIPNVSQTQYRPRLVLYLPFARVVRSTDIRAGSALSFLETRDRSRLSLKQ